MSYTPYASSVVFTALAAANLIAGQPVYVDRVTSKVNKADALTQSTSTCQGLALAAVALGYPATISKSILVLPDWTMITGSVALAPGQPYFLTATPGMLSATATTIVGQFVTQVGIAVNATTFEVNAQQPILL